MFLRKERGQPLIDMDRCECHPVAPFCLRATILMRINLAYEICFPALDLDRNVTLFSDMEAIFTRDGDLPFEGNWDGQSRPMLWSEMGEEKRKELVDARRYARGRRLYGATLFRELDQEHPNSLFILNLRNRTDWIQSRLLHPYCQSLMLRLCHRSTF